MSNDPTKKKLYYVHTIAGAKIQFYATGYHIDAANNRVEFENPDKQITVFFHGIAAIEEHNPKSSTTPM